MNTRLNAVRIAQRNREIVSRARAGETAAALAAEHGIGRQRVAQILNHERQRVRNGLARALSHGDLVRGTTCQICGGLAVDAHHYDYDAIDHCVWLCSRCHGAADVLRQRGEAERTVGEALYNSREAATYLGVWPETFNKYVKRHGAKRATRRGPRYYRAADLDRLRLAVDAASAPQESCRHGHKMTPENSQHRDGRGVTCKACNSLKVNRVRRTARASRYVVLQAIVTIGGVVVQAGRGLVITFDLAGVRLHMRCGGKSPWYCNVANDRKSEVALWTIVEIVAWAKANSHTQQAVAA